MSWAWISRFLFDHLFNTILMVLLLNIVFGLVIDTFSEMRAETERRMEDMETKCTMCDLPAGKFDQIGMGFKAHIAWEHNVWDYFMLFAFLQRKNSLEFTGIESYIDKKLSDLNEAKDIFPIHKAISLARATGDGNMDYDGDDDEDDIEALAASQQASPQ